MSATEGILQLLEKTRDGYDAEGVWVRFLIDAYHGSGGFQGRVKQPCAGYWGAAAEAYSGFTATLSLPSGGHAGEKGSYLDRHPREDWPEFQRRINVSHYPNYVRPTTNLKVSYVVRKPHTRIGLPDELKAWIETTGYDKEFRRRALAAAVMGWFVALVDMPAPDAQALTAAQAGKLTPYVVGMLPCQLLDYSLDDRGALVWAKTVTRYTRKEWDGKSAGVSRYTIWQRKTVTVFEVVEVGGEKTVNPLGEKPHRFGGPTGAVPLVSWRAEASVEDPIKADSLNADIAVEARRLFNVVSELDDHIRGQMFAVLVLPQRATNESVEIGNSTGLSMDPDAKNPPMYLAPPPSVAETLEKRIEASIIEIYRMARVEYDRASGTRSSAQSKEQNFQQTNLAISDFAQSLANADRETLILVGRGLGISEDKLQGIVCQAHDSYESGELNDEIDAITATLGLSIGLTAKVELLKRLTQRQLPGLDAETRARIEREIQDAADQAEKDAAAEKALLLTKPEDVAGDDEEDDSEAAAAAEE